MQEFLKLRPHHILDIIRNYGRYETFTPHPYSHAQHLISEELVSDLYARIKLVVASDDICTPCKHLLSNNLCNDVLHQLDPPLSKQDYNDSLDQKLLPYFNLQEGLIITFYDFLQIINQKIPGIEEICSHPKEDKNERLKGMIYGLKKLGIRK